MFDGVLNTPLKRAFKHSSNQEVHVCVFTVKLKGKKFNGGNQKHSLKDIAKSVNAFFF